MVKPAEMAVRRPGEKASNFSVTCSLFSQYLREKGGFGDLGLGISAAATPLVESRGRPEALRTMNLFPGTEANGGDDGWAADQDAGSEGKEESERPMDLFPQVAGFDDTSGEKKPDRIREPQRAQMTVFYGGKVVVFDNFPADKARELMTMAGRGCPAPAQRLRAEQQTPPQQRPPPAQHNPTPTTAPASTSDAKSAAAVPTPAVAPPQTPSRPAASRADLPIARRVSLHRFLEKRKDRISARAPYLVSSSPPAPPTKPEENRRWLGLAPNVSMPEDLHR
uniref:Protein TIFY n=1 Tax=Anthurium amnicola TaxID=1678845 RepID=A0A1D1YVR1_9ARAE